MEILRTLLFVYQSSNAVNLADPNPPVSAGLLD